MGYAYANRLTEVAAVFPAATFTPLEIRNEDQNGYAVASEAFTVPATDDGDGKYRLHLLYQPLEQSTFALSVDGDELTPIPWGEEPAVDEVALSLEQQAAEFHEDLAGLAGEASYTGRGSVITAALLMMLQKEIAAVETLLRASPPVVVLQGCFFGVQDANTTAGWEIQFKVPGSASGTWLVRAVTVVHADNSLADAATDVKVNTTGVGGGGDSITAQVAMGSRAGSRATGSIAVSTGATLYAFISNPGKHQNVQFTIELRPSGL